MLAASRSRKRPQERSRKRPSLELALPPLAAVGEQRTEVWHYNESIDPTNPGLVKTFKVSVGEGGDSQTSWFVKKAPVGFELKDFDPFGALGASLVTNGEVNYVIMPDHGADLFDYSTHIYNKSNEDKAHIKEELHMIVYGLLQVAESLKEGKVLHHDLKLENFTVNKDGEVFVIDWVHDPSYPSKSSSVESFSQTQGGAGYRVTADDNLKTIAHLIILLEIVYKEDPTPTDIYILSGSTHAPGHQAAVQPEKSAASLHKESMKIIHDNLSRFESEYVPQGFFDNEKKIELPSPQDAIKGKAMASSVNTGEVDKDMAFWRKLTEHQSLPGVVLDNIEGMHARICAESAAAAAGGGGAAAATTFFAKNSVSNSCHNFGI